MLTLTAESRTATGKAAKALLDEGQMPAIVYGPNQEATAISLPQREFVKILRDAGESAVIELSGVGSGSFQVLIQDVDRDPVTSLPRHADLYAIKKGAKVTVSVPLSFINEAPAAKLGASIIKVMHELEVEADPSKLPHDIEVDLEVLAENGDQVLVKDIKLPAGVVATADAEEAVVIAKEEAPEAEEETAAPDMDAIEVEQKGKSDDEGGDEAPAE